MPGTESSNFSVLQRSIQLFYQNKGPDPDAAARFIRVNEAGAGFSIRNEKVVTLWQTEL